MENNEIIRLQEDLKYWENAFLRLQEQHRVIQKLFYELRGKQEEETKHYYGIDITNGIETRVIIHLEGEVMVIDKIEQNKIEEKKMKYDKRSFMWAVQEAINGIVTKRKSKSFLLKITRFGTPKFQRQEGRKNYVDLGFEDYFAIDWEVVEEKKPNMMILELMLSVI